MELGLKPLREIINGLSVRLFNYGAMWFIPVLFVTDALFYSISKIGNKFLILLILLCSAEIGWLLYHFSINLPLSLSGCFAAMFFYGMGFFGKDWLKTLFLRFYYIPIFFAIQIVLLFFSGETIGMMGNIIPHPLCSYSMAVAGLLGFILISNQLSINKWKRITNSITFWGRNTLTILCMHMIFISYSATYIHPFISKKWLYKGVEFLFILGMILITVFVINKYFPWMVNRKKDQYVKK
jgi:fucose 4-O-acetylase-like acetyltransferase